MGCELGATVGGPPSPIAASRAPTLIDIPAATRECSQTTQNPLQNEVFWVEKVIQQPPQPRNTERPGNSASAPSCSSMRSSWLYFAVRSERQGAPVLICPQPVATARSAIVTSSVSPER